MTDSHSTSGSVFDAAPVRPTPTIETLRAWCEGETVCPPALAGRYTELCEWALHTLSAVVRNEPLPAPEDFLSPEDPALDVEGAGGLTPRELELLTVVSGAAEDVTDPCEVTECKSCRNQQQDLLKVGTDPSGQQHLVCLVCGASRDWPES